MFPKIASAGWWSDLEAAPFPTQRGPHQLTSWGASYPDGSGQSMRPKAQTQAQARQCNNPFPFLYSVLTHSSRVGEMDEIQWMTTPSPISELTRRQQKPNEGASTNPTLNNDVEHDGNALLDLSWLASLLCASASHNRRRPFQ